MRRRNEITEEAFRMELKTVLVVDDEAELRKILALELERRGIRVLQASDGIQALAVLEKERVDVVVSDIRMPNGSGLNLLDAIRRQDPGAPDVLLTTGDCQNEIQEAMKKGAIRVFIKPFSLRDLAAEVIDCLIRREAEGLSTSGPKRNAA